MEYKTASFEEAQKITEKSKKQGKKVVLCHGLFHFLHIGHIRYLKQAKNYGDIIIVSIIADKFIDENENVRFDEKLRAEAIASLGWIDAVFINPFKDVYELIKNINPDIYLKGFESKGNDSHKKNNYDNELELYEKIGVDFVIAEENDFSSTSQINRYLVTLSDDIEKYLQFFKQRYSVNELFKTIDAMHGLNVLVIGDTILDEYQYCSAIGKSSKDPMLALKYESHDMFAGGVLAVANHAAGFARSVDLLTILGEKDSHEAFIRSKLKKNVNPNFLFKPNAPTLIKRRFLDGYSMNKLLEVYVMDDSVLEGKLEKKLHNLIKDRLAKYDLVIAADFGHGAINANLRKMLSQKAPYLAVNAQSNAGNRGFNNIAKYPKADYISMSEHEIRLEMRDLTGKIRLMMEKLAQKMKCQKITVTRGRKGCMVNDNKGGFVQVPSFTQKVVDRIGAGDALFALTSLSAVQDAPCEIIGFLGNVAGTLSVEIMGNQQTIDKNTVTEYIYKLFSL